MVMSAKDSSGLGTKTQKRPAPQPTHRASMSGVGQPSKTSKESK